MTILLVELQSVSEMLLRDRYDNASVVSFAKAMREYINQSANITYRAVKSFLRHSVLSTSDEKLLISCEILMQTTV